MFSFTNLARLHIYSVIGLSSIILLASFGMSTSNAKDQRSAQTNNLDQPWADLGRTPTPSEIKAWDIDVRPDFKGLPAGRGSVEQGMEVWETKCASCHGVFGESNEVFTPLIGGTTAEDIERGQLAGLVEGGHPYRTTMMRLSQISTLWDYINRAMPWNEPKSLSPDDVYAVIAYMLNLAEIVDVDFEFSHDNIAQVQAKLPNRNGMKKFEPLWRVDGKADVQGDDCMSDCEAPETVQSRIPDYARNAHGNLAEQNRLIGPVRGADTTQAAPASLSQARQIATALTATPPLPARSVADAADPIKELAQASGCLACHAIDKKGVGPALTDIAKRYRDEATAVALLSDRIRQGAAGTWGAIPMPCLLYTSPSPRDRTRSRMPSSA